MKRTINITNAANIVLYEILLDVLRLFYKFTLEVDKMVYFFLQISILKCFHALINFT